MKRLPLAIAVIITVYHYVSVTSYSFSSLAMGAEKPFSNISNGLTNNIFIDDNNDQSK